MKTGVGWCQPIDFGGDLIRTHFVRPPCMGEIRCEQQNCGWIRWIRWIMFYRMFWDEVVQKKKDEWNECHEIDYIITH